jgi:hypothetical protein
MKTTHWIIVGVFIIAILISSALQGTTLVGKAVTTTGCCTLICQETTADECPTKFIPGELCSQVDECNVGCCVDNEGYCYSNYLKNNCEVSGSLFVSERECDQHPACLTAPTQRSLRGYTGFPYIYPTFTEGIVTTDYFARQIGQPFTIKTILFDENQHDDVRVSIKDEGFSKTLLLYDDGDHGDGKEGDGLFANIWFTQDFPPFEGFKVLTINATVNNQPRIPPERILLSAESCLPLSRNWGENYDDIIFIESNTDTTTLRAHTNANAIIGVLGQVFPPEQFQEKNFYEVLPVGTTQNITKAEQTVQQKCTFYDKTEDVLFFIDNTALYCEQKEKIIRVPPTIFLNRTAVDKTDIALDIILSDFCTYTLTQSQLQQQIILALIPPNITIHYPVNNTQYTTNGIDFSFTINDTHDTVHYEIYRDINRPETMMYRSKAPQNEAVNLTLNISDGEHNIWIEATDEHDNLVASEIITININNKNFITTIETLEPLTYNHSPQINFTITHNTETDVNYTIILNSSSIITSEAYHIVNDTTPVNQLVQFQTNLTNGTHIIQVVATDSNGNTAPTLPYIFYIGQYPEEVFG